MQVRLVYPTGVDPTDVAAVRRAIGMSQPEFAAAFGISVWTLRKWEQGRRAPQGPARALLQVIAREPAAARRALAADRPSR
jgi:putative transcriptional regulator